RPRRHGSGRRSGGGVGRAGVGGGRACTGCQGRGCRLVWSFDMRFSDQFGSSLPLSRRAVRGNSRPRSYAQVYPRTIQPFTLSPRWPGGEGRVRGADQAVCGAAHLTLPDAVAPGPLPLPPVGRRGAVFPNGEPTDDPLSIEDSGNSATSFDSPDSPARSGNPGQAISRLPPVHARGRLWTPAFAGATRADAT